MSEFTSYEDRLAHGVMVGADIERAVAAERDRIRAAVEAIPEYYPRFNGGHNPWPDEIVKAMKDRVLAIVG
jgi:hypothetical protein